ncbi:MAG: hypothetical protein AAFO94_05245, partial [Bacteroidota bacterium]
MNNINWKSILSVIGLLLIGYVGGFHHHRTIVKDQIRRISDHRMEVGGRFTDRFFDHIDATEAQREILSPIIEQHLREMQVINKEMRSRRRPVLDSMRAEIEVHLQADQQEAFEAFMRKVRRPFPGGKGKPGKRKQKKDSALFRIIVQLHDVNSNYPNP